MYFYKKGGKQYLDLKGTLVLSHNDALVKSRVKSAAPEAVYGGNYGYGIPNMGLRSKLVTTWHALAFIWGRSRALTAEDTNLKYPKEG